MSDTLITVAIHTFRHACALKSLLEKEGVEVTLQNVNLSSPTVAAGVRVRIHESDLPVALRIIENPDIFSETYGKDDSAPFILVPTDLSEHAGKACYAAFHLANRHDATIRLLYSYVDPVYSKRSQLNDSLTFDNDSEHDKATDEVQADAEERLSSYENRLVKAIKEGLIPPVKFSHNILEGIPEDVINQYAREHHPLMLVMGTRDAGAKARELVGSVTAEVLDTCRFPIMTIPESAGNIDISEIKNIMFFSNFDQQDVIALDTLIRLLSNKSLNILFVKLPSKKFSGDITEPLSKLLDYAKAHYPDHNFSMETMNIDTVEDDFRRLIKDNGVRLIAVPNKKRNMFARFFNPGLAHRLLFRSDIPMMVVPV